MVYTQKYLSTTEWASFRGVTPTTTTNPTLSQVETYIELAEKRFEREVGDYSTQTGLVKVFKGLKHGLSTYYPITAVSSINISNGDLITPTWSSVASTDYVLKDDGRILLRNPYIHREYQVTFDSGYAIADVPQEIKYLVFLMSMAHAFEEHLFESNVSDNTTRIVDVEVYREITRGGDPFKGFSALDRMIDDGKNAVRGKLRTRLG